MKILGVKFKNLSAMNGEWEIRFDQPPLSDTGLFAIVGPNGSGKTTILDALSLALYGETPRLKNPESGIINWQSNDSYAEVTFAIDNHVYRSKWSARKIAGRSEPPEMCLADCNGTDTILEDRVIRVRDRVAELTGLDFKRFCRSILLAQGEFAAFLDALDSERAEILERIIGPELTREMEDAVEAQVRLEESRLHELQEAAATHVLPDKVRIEALEESVEHSREELQEINRILEECRVQDDWLQSVALRESEQSTAAEMLAVAEAAHAQAGEDLRRLEAALPARPFLQEVSVLEDLQTEAQAAAEALQQLETSIRTHEDRTHVLEESLRECRVAMDQARHHLQERSEEIQGAWLRDRDIAAEEQRFQEAGVRHEDLERSQADALRQQVEIADRMAALQVRRQEIDQWLTANSRDARLETDIPAVEEVLNRINELRAQQEAARTGKPEAIKADRRNARQRRRAEKALLKARSKTDQAAARKTKREQRLAGVLGDGTLASLIADYRNRKHQLEACRQLVKIGQEYQEQVVDEDLHAALARIQAEQERLTQSLALEQAQLTVLEESAQWRETLKKLSPEREVLKPASPCPLCGAMDHPFVDHGLPEFATIDVNLRDQRRKVTALRIQLSSLSASDTQIRAQVATLATIRKAWAEACAQAGGEWAISNPEAVVADIRIRKKEIKRCKSRIRSARWHSWRFQRLSRSFHQRSDQLAVREQACEQIRVHHQQSSQALADLEEELRKLRQNEGAARELLAEMLEPIHEMLPGVDQEQALLARLRSRRQEYREQVQERDASNDELISLETRQQTLPQDLEHIRGQLETVSAELAAAGDRLAALKAEREELFGTFDPVLERQDLEQQIELGNAQQVALREEIETIRRTLRQQHDDLPEVRERAGNAQEAAAESEARLTEQVLAAGISSVDELRAHIARLDKEQTIRERHANTEQAFNEARSHREAARQALETVRAEQRGDDPLELVRWKMTEAAKHRDTVQAQWRDAEADLRELRDAEREYREIQRAITDQRKVCDRLRAEQGALHSQDSAAAARKLQRIMMDRLLDRANSYLEVLSGRYALRPLSDEGFGLQIEDALEARDCRPVKTLSGGESFVVSLCLALGLSEMASDDRKIESLFLDEGFGTLDDEMLYRVMTALKRLRANGKMVGIISHVKRLADEITTQIRVEKQPGGSSRITIVA